MDRFLNVLHKGAVFSLIGATVFLGVQMMAMTPGAREVNRKQLAVDRKEYQKKLAETGGVAESAN